MHCCVLLFQNGRSVSKRGVSCQFGPDVTERFLEQNKLEIIVRSHEVKGEGYEVTHSGKCITVFSAPNYWYLTLFASLHVHIYKVNVMTVTYIIKKTYWTMLIQNMSFSHIKHHN